MPEVMASSDDDQTLQNVQNHFQDQKGDFNLDWNYLSNELMLGPPPGVPPVTVPLKLADTPKPNPKIDIKRRRLTVHLTSEYGDAVIFIYYGTLSNELTYQKPEKGQPTWRVYVGLNVATKFDIVDVPVAGALDQGAIGVSAIQLLITTTDMSPSAAFSATYWSKITSCRRPW